MLAYSISLYFFLKKKMKNLSLFLNLVKLAQVFSDLESVELILLA